MDRLNQAIANTRARLLAEMQQHGHWEGELSSSALSTATAVVALSLVDATANEGFIRAGIRWIVAHQNSDGGWGDTPVSRSNLSTTLLCWSALGIASQEAPIEAVRLCEMWIRNAVGSLRPEEVAQAVIARYGKDKTFSVPILMMATLCGRLGDKAWSRVLPLPFELAVLPRSWFGAIGLPVVSYALPALIAIGHARFHHAPPGWWSPLRWIRAWAWKRVRPMLSDLMPSSGGYLEATPLTSFVTMALAGSGEKDHPCVPRAVEFLHRSMRADGSWPIDTNLATWGTTLAVKALGDDLPREQRSKIKSWLLDQQYTSIHPFTNAAPGGWAWTDLPGGGRPQDPLRAGCDQGCRGQGGRGDRRSTQRRRTVREPGARSGGEDVGSQYDRLARQGRRHGVGFHDVGSADEPAVRRYRQQLFRAGERSQQRDHGLRPEDRRDPLALAGRPGRRLERGLHDRP